MADKRPTGPMDRRVAVRPMRESDLDLVEGWLCEPHVARWWLAGSTLAAELGGIRAQVCGEGDTATHMLLVAEGDRPIGWAQWYRWGDYPTEAAAMGARPGEMGIDYAIGDPAAVGRHLGTEMIAALVRHLHCVQPEAGIVVGPDAENLASRAVLEKNGFELVEVRPVASEPTPAPIAIYRLAAQPARLATTADAPAVGRMLDRSNPEYDVLD
jgi:aminoglycoside 6'-N-acetyltransferase